MKRGCECFAFSVLFFLRLVRGGSTEHSQLVKTPVRNNHGHKEPVVIRLIETTNVVNRSARTEAASLIRAFLSGEIDNISFIDRFPHDRNDRALHAVERRLWFHYDDVTPHHCEFPLDSAAEVLFRRCALFLETDLEYQWPELRGHNLSHPIVAILSGDIFRFRRIEEAKKAGDYDVWPFFRKADLCDAKSRYGEEQAKTHDQSLGIAPSIATVGKFAVLYIAAQTLLFFAGFVLFIGGIFWHSGVLLVSGIVCAALYVLSLLLGRFVRPRTPTPTVRTT